MDKGLPVIVFFPGLKTIIHNSILYSSNFLYSVVNPIFISLAASVLFPLVCVNILCICCFSISESCRDAIFCVCSITGRFPLLIICYRKESLFSPSCFLTHVYCLSRDLFSIFLQNSNSFQVVGLFTLAAKNARKCSAKGSISLGRSHNAEEKFEIQRGGKTNQNGNVRHQYPFEDYD